MKIVILAIFLYLAIGEIFALLPVFIDKGPFIYENYYDDIYDPKYIAICYAMYVIFWPIIILLAIVINFFLNIGKLIIEYRKGIKS